MNSLSYIALTGSLGTGFKSASLDRGVEREIAFVGSDSGSTDGGPYYLGSESWIWSNTAYERDMRLGLLGARQAGVPLIIGSCGGGGNDTAVDGYFEMADRIAKENGFKLKVACIYTQPDRNFLVDKYRRGQIRSLPGAPDIDEKTFVADGHIVAMSGAEPIQRALETGADLVLVGRCADAAIFAAIPLARGFDPGPVWNAAKIVECGAAAAENRSGQDSILCTLEDDGFILEPLDPELRCTPSSVAAHTMYETADPYRLIMPSGTLDARDAHLPRLGWPSGQGRRRDVHAFDGVHSQARGRRPSRVPVIILGFCPRSGDPHQPAQLDRIPGDPHPPTAVEHLRRRLPLRPEGIRGQWHHSRALEPDTIRGGHRLRPDRRIPSGGVGDGPGRLPCGPALAGQSLEGGVDHDLRPPVQRAGRRPGTGLPFHLEPRRGHRRRRTGSSISNEHAGGRMTPTSGLDNATTYFKLIRSKDAGPFMLTIDLFFEGRAAYDAFAAAEVFTAESVGNLYGVAPASVDIYNIPDIDAVKISFPRPVVSGDFGDTDITGGQQYGLIIDMVSALDITTDPLRVTAR